MFGTFRKYISKYDCQS